MRKLLLFGLLTLPFVFLLSGIRASAPQQEVAALRLVQTILMPGVQGRLDHMAIDAKGQRLFVAALGDNQNTVEVIDLKAGKQPVSIPGQSKPQGVFYSPDFHRLFVANGNDGTLKIFEGDTFKLITSLPIGPDADHVGYDPASKILYVGFGDAKSGGLAMIDTRTNQHVGDIKTDARAGGIKIEKASSRTFVTLTGNTALGVVDLKGRQQTATWPVTTAPGSVALAFDEKDHRLFDGVREPPTLIVVDTETGKTVSTLEGVPGIDDLWYDAAHKRIYASGGRGFDVGSVYVYQQKDADHYELSGKVPTKPGAGTSFWSPDFNRYYVAAPANDKEEAAVLVFEPQP